MEELTPLEEERPLEVEEVDELVSDEVVPDEVEVELDAVEVEAVLGIVAALIAVKRPTRPTAAKAAA